MADYTSRRTLMVDTQVRPSDVTKFPIIDALLSVPREEYVPDGQRDAAYIGENISLGEDRVVLEPRTLAKMLDAVDVQPTDVILDLGCGLGYSTAVLAHMAEFVVALEDDASRAADAEAILAAQGVDNAAVFEGALADGNAKSGPFDVIILQGAIEVMPDSLVDQLREGGRMVAIFADGALGEVRVGRKIDGVMNWRMSFNAGAPVLAGFAKEAAFSL
ncbi:protein-L-isoaspartate O-methyltransferase family protein [Pseudooctadecabacter jejudonensis]|uniref:Protein-L-isoaspartate O-methyltransferase n=1 Tax=Pseudooctadecabacter jejudonensis TaxID=1391910 RepID=A0A1Y5RRP6_9RHOB|nr:protein-L-isoaspartate O-methyltransferase [Pseudooctadecabacter jejudonensis]SLN23842.1 Protein-L-isoaspartate O-methyltransferase [Pseudooctadecabacter jejudonensis]